MNMDEKEIKKDLTTPSKSIMQNNDSEYVRLFYVRLSKIQTVSGLLCWEQENESPITHKTEVEPYDNERTVKVNAIEGVNEKVNERQRVSEVQDLLKENQSPAAEFNVNLVTAFSVIVREPEAVETSLTCPAYRN